MGVRRFLRLTGIWVLSIIYTAMMLLVSCKQFLLKPKKFLSCKKRTERPKCLDDPDFTHCYIRLKNLRMHYVCTGEEGKPLMLMLHGFPECWYSWRHQLREFSKDYRVVAVDNRGYNETEEPSAVEDYSIVNMREDTRQLIEGLGYKECVLVGHDWGGALAWDFAANHPEYVKKLIVLNGPNEAMAESLTLKQFMMSWYMFYFQMPYIPEWLLRRGDLAFVSSMYKPLVSRGLMTDDDVEAYRFCFRNSLTGPINYYRAAMRIKPKTKAGRKNRYKMPTLILWSEKDMALSVELGQKTAAKADNGTLFIVPNAGHFLQHECPDLVNKSMRDWLATGELQN